MPKTIDYLRIIRGSDDGAGVNLSGAGIVDEYIPEIVEELKKHPLLDHLNISRNNITVVGAELLATLPLIHLNINSNHLRDAGALKILQNSKLKELDIGGNAITDVAAKAILENLNLVYLNVDRSSYLSKDMLALLKQHPKNNWERIEQAKALSKAEQKSGSGAAAVSPRFKFASNKVHPIQEEKEAPVIESTSVPKGQKRP